MAETPSSKSSNEEFTSPGQSFATVDDGSADNAAASFGDDFADEGGHGEDLAEGAGGGVGGVHDRLRLR